MHTPPKILIVDDAPLNVSLLEQLLDELGYQTVSAANGQEALTAIATTNPDLVLLDLMMPVMDGFQVLAQAKNNAVTRDLPIIVISALDDLSSIVRAVSSGADDYLPKPFEPVLLQARVTASLKKKRLHDLEVLYRQALERELEIGREIQASFLPARLPQVQGWELAARFHAQRRVAGDLYDAFLLPRAGRVCLAVGDVSGKGVGAALYMTLFRTLLRVLVLQADAGDTQAALAFTDDAALLIHCVDFMNDYVARTHGKSNMFASLWVGLLDPEDGTVTFVNAGHNPPLVLGRGAVRERLARTGMVVGLSHFLFRAESVPLEPGETLLVYTDGVTEALNPQGQEFGEGRLEVAATQNTDSVDALLGRIEEQVFAFMGGAEQADDITLLGIRRAAKEFG